MRDKSDQNSISPHFAKISHHNCVDYNYNNFIINRKDLLTVWIIAVAGGLIENLAHVDICTGD